MNTFQKPWSATNTINDEPVTMTCIDGEAAVITDDREFNTVVDVDRDGTNHISTSE